MDPEQQDHVHPSFKNERLTAFEAVTGILGPTVRLDPSTRYNTAGSFAAFQEQ